MIYPVEKKSQLDKARTSAMCVVDLGTLHVTSTQLFLRSTHLTVAREGTATCYRNETDGKSDGRGSERNSWQPCGATSGHNLKPRGQQVNQANCVSEEKPFALPINYNEERACEDNVIAVKINGTVTRMLVDSGAQSTVLGEQQFHNLERNGLKANLMPEERNLRVYGNGCLPVVSTFEVTIACHGQKVVETVLVTQGEGQCLLGSPPAKKLEVLKSRLDLLNTKTVHSIGTDINSIVRPFPKLFSGVGKLCGNQLINLHQQHRNQGRSLTLCKIKSIERLTSF